MSSILEQLAETECGLRRFYFMKDHRKEIERAIALGEFPKKPAWDPLEHWPWLRQRRAVPAPAPVVAGRSIPHIEQLETLPFKDRLNFYRAHKNEIRDELENFREAHNRF